MTTVAERAARHEAVTPDTSNPHNCQPFLAEAMAETLAGMSKAEQAMLTRAIIEGDCMDAWVRGFLSDVREYAQTQAYEVGNV